MTAKKINWNDLRTIPTDTIPWKNCPYCDWFGITHTALNTHIGRMKDEAHRNQPLVAK